MADCDYSTQKCVPLAGEGESCEQVSCKRGLVCAGETGSMTCRQPVAAGGDCLNMDECQAGLICSQGKCIEPGGSGESCYVGSEMTLALFACKPGLYCDADIVHQQTTGTCKPQKAAGQQCIMFYECVSGLVCKGVKLDRMTGQVTPGQCATPQQEGQPCDTELGFPECDWDLYCDEDSGTCKPVPGLGDACVYDGNPECVGDDLYCDSLQQGVEGTCRQKKEAGSNCTSGEECLSGYCDQGTCRETDCIPPGA
ncbi:MAG: hypothetical protein D6806_16125 [Deltaproteobacteria bacterium]|nr:MAG: hypothetical protein D6806_16125 [Deltaproteobacteria bacterium]